MVIIQMCEKYSLRDSKIMFGRDFEPRSKWQWRYWYRSRWCNAFLRESHGHIDTLRSPDSGTREAAVDQMILQRETIITSQTPTSKTWTLPPRQPECQILAQPYYCR